MEFEPDDVPLMPAVISVMREKVKEVGELPLELLLGPPDDPLYFVEKHDSLFKVN